MTVNEFAYHFGRLENHFRMPEDMKRDLEYEEWARSVLHYDVAVLEDAVTFLIREHESNFWPPLSAALSRIRSRMPAREPRKPKCATCHDSSWIESWPWRSNGHTYTGYQRCPDCGVPEPSYKNHEYREPLNATEYAQFLRGELPDPPMPISRGHAQRNQKPVAMERFKAPAFAEVLKQRSREPGEEG